MTKKTAAKKSAPLANAFIGRPKPPADKELSEALGATRPMWDQLLDDLAELKVSIREWNSYSQKAGWSLRVKRGDRTIAYLAPCEGYFRASFALGEKALRMAKNSGLPAPVLDAIESAKKYAEGTAVRIEVKSAEDVAVVKALAKAKLSS